MNPTWHLIKKDFRRQRGPLAMFTLLVVTEILFYACISGLFSVPDIEWLRRVQSGPEVLLRFLAEPVFAYFMVGWMVFEDSPVEQDAHWLTRPISGAQMFAAKLAGAWLMFVLWPLGLNVVWWFACGVSPHDIVVSAGEFLGMHSALVALGLACAALTGGFPRFILWSLVGAVVFGMAQLGFSLLSGSTLGFVRFIVCVAGSGLAGLAIAGHQFVTRRRKVSLVLVGVGLVLVGVVGSAWRWDFWAAGMLPLAPESADSTKLGITITGPARYHFVGGRHYAELPVQVAGVPDKAALARLTIRGDWSFGGEKAWTSQAVMDRPSPWREAIRRQLGFATQAGPDGRITLSLPFSLPMAQRAAREPAAFLAQAELELRPGEILAELPVRDGRSGAYAVSYVSSGPLREKRPAGRAGTQPVLEQSAVSLLLTEKSAQGMRANSTFRAVATHCALVNRRTGEFFLEDPVRSGPEARTILNQALVACQRLTFLLEQKPVNLDDLTLVVFRFAGSELLKRELSVAALPFAADSLPEAAALPAGPGTQRMSELVQAHAAGDRFMGSVLVAKGDATVFTESAGWADVDGKVPNTVDTRFRIGSLTKQFTAVAILLLEERGRLSVDDLLGKYIPDIPESWRAVTLRHLLTHTSGILNFTDLPEYGAWEQTPLSPAEMVDHLRDRSLDFPPGEKFKYSNTGYVLLGRVVELASGQDYGAFLRDRVFLPLGMKDSGYEADVPADPARARGYVPGAAGPVRAKDIDMHVPGGAGGLYSTTPDLLRWTQGLFGGRVLSPVSLEKLTTPGRNGYGFGVGITTVDGRKVIAHAGAIAGFISQLSYYPDEKMTVAVLANLGGAPVAELSRQLTEVAFGQTVILTAERKEVEVPVATLQRYVGVYQLAPGVTNTVRLVDGRLTVQLSGQRAFPVFPESDRKFFLKVVDAQVEFVMDEQGRVTHLLQFQNGRTQTALRVGDVMERKVVAVPPDLLAAYVGHYELRPDLVVTVTLENGQLMAAAPGQGKSVLLAETETKFFSTLIDAQIEFFRDDRGAVTRLVIHAAGKDQPGSRQP